MSRWLLLVLAALLLGVAIAGATYFVFRQEDKEFACDSSQQPAYNTYQVTRRGFPFVFYTQTAAPQAGGCQRPAGQGGEVITHSDFSKQEFFKNFAAWAAAAFVVITPLWLGGKRNG